MQPINTMENNSIRIELSDDRTYSIFQESLAQVPALLRKHAIREGKCLLITDLNVGSLYAGAVGSSLQENGWTVRTVTLPPGEPTKSVRYLQEIYDAALSWRIDRKTTVLALGGGVIGDLAGFAASTLLRGLPLVQLPTSLLAQVDSSIGGKTGINHEAGKNLIGSFYQPVFVCSDPAVLSSLPLAEWTGGLSEVVKHGLIDDRRYFDWLSEHIVELRDRSSSLISEMILRSAAIKGRIVGADEKELGLRAHLNFGHTFGHALERVTGYGTYSHGEAVLLGMKAAIHLSALRHPDQTFDSARQLLSALPSPAVTDHILLEDLLTAMKSDKKSEAGVLRFVLLRQIGEAYIADDVSEDEIREAWSVALRSSTLSSTQPSTEPSTPADAMPPNPMP